MGQTISYPRFRAYAADGTTPLAGGKLHTYSNGTTTPRATYADAALTTPNANPVILNAQGEAWLYRDDDAIYTFKLTDANDVLIWQQDDIGTSAGQVTALDYLTDAQRADVAAGTFLVDCTANLQAALDANVSLDLPSGGYLVTGSLKYQNGQQINGYGSTTTTIKGNILAALIKKNTSPSTMTGVRISGITLDNTAKTNSGGIGIDATDTEDMMIEDVVIKNVETGISCSGSHRMTAKNFKINTVTTGINLPSASTASPVSVQLEQFYITGATTGIAVNKDCNFCTATKGRFYTTTTAFAIGAAGVVSNLHIEDCYFHTDVTNVNTIGSGAGTIIYLNNLHASGTAPSFGSYDALRNVAKGIAFGSGAGIYSGTGAPTFSAVRGSLYIRTDPTSLSDTWYMNTNGSTTWVSTTQVAS